MLDLEALARRRTPKNTPDPACVPLMMTRADTLVSLCGDILECEVEVRESAPEPRGDLLEVLATIRSERLVVVDRVGSNEFVNDTQISFVEKLISETEGDGPGVSVDMESLPFFCLPLSGVTIFLFIVYPACLERSSAALRDGITYSCYAYQERGREEAVQISLWSMA